MNKLFPLVLALLFFSCDDETLCIGEHFKLDNNGEPLIKKDCMIQNSAIELQHYLNGPWNRVERDWTSDLSYKTIEFSNDTCFFYEREYTFGDSVYVWLESFHIVDFYLKEEEFTGYYIKKSCEAVQVPENPYWGQDTPPTYPERLPNSGIYAMHDKMVWYSKRMGEIEEFGEDFGSHKVICEEWKKQQVGPHFKINIIDQKNIFSYNHYPTDIQYMYGNPIKKYSELLRTDEDFIIMDE